MIALTSTPPRTERRRLRSKTHGGERRVSQLGYRFYSPSIGRWISRDPIGENGELGIYAYVGNRTLCNVDKLGLFPCKWVPSTSMLSGGGEWVLIRFSPPMKSMETGLYPFPFFKVLYRCQTYDYQYGRWKCLCLFRGKEKVRKFNVSWGPDVWVNGRPVMSGNQIKFEWREPTAPCP
jgi:RHS repeat-associated protein